jgi:hypothetical protein
LASILVLVGNVLAQLVPPQATVVGVVIVIVRFGEVGRGVSPRSIRVVMLVVGRSRRGRIPHLGIFLELELDATTRLLLLGAQQRGKHCSAGNVWMQPAASSFTNHVSQLHGKRNEVGEASGGLSGC